MGMGRQMVLAMWCLETEGGLTCSVSSFLFKKIPNPIKAQVFEGSVALQSFSLLLFYPTG